MPADMTLHQLETELDSFSADSRRGALDELAARASRGEIDLPPAGPDANLHMHSFFSYNADGHSPSRIAWEARKAGLFAAGVVEFDVLDGLDEFLAAGDVLGIRAVVGVESRVFVAEYADRDINSPGEPGISYFMGTGFHRLPEAGSGADATLRRMRDLARARNEAMTERVNRHLGAAAIGYEKDVLPLTPSGNATERHMLAAYEEKAAEVFAAPADRAAYWSEKLGEPGRAVALEKDSVAFRELLRARLMKRGGVGYAAPEKGNFPALEDVAAMVATCGALPCGAWLDGTSAGEADPAEVVEFYASKGALALNVIPDRNWNVEDPDVRETKTANLHAIVEAAWAAGLVLVYGTERNKHGQPLFDDLSVEALAPVADRLREGAYTLYGHTAMARHARRPLSCRDGEWCVEAFGGNRRERNAFYAEVGRLVEPGGPGERLASACEADSPAEILARLRG
jgi:hypothetical protein